MVYRIYVEKKQGLDNEARALLGDLRELLGLKGLEKVRILNRYDCEGIDEELFDYAVNTVFSEPQLDDTMEEIPVGNHVFAVEYLPGQFDQRAASASECIQLISKGERPLIRSAKVYVLNGTLSDEELEAAKNMLSIPWKPEKQPWNFLRPLKSNMTYPKTWISSRTSDSRRMKNFRT